MVSKSKSVLDDDDLEASLGKLLQSLGRPVCLDELLRILGLPRRRKKQIVESLYTLQDKGEVLRVEDRWASRHILREVEGVFRVSRGGRAFLSRPDASDAPPIDIPPPFTGGAWHGDRVKVLLLPPTGPGRGKRLGRVTEIVGGPRAELSVCAGKDRGKGKWLCDPVDDRIQARFLVDVGGIPGPVRKGDLLLVQPEREISPGLWQGGAVLNSRQEQSPAVQERLVKRKYSVPTVFPDPALREVASLKADPDEDDFAGREDLCHLGFVTIDGERARDFDDAVFVRPTDEGYQLLVAIADVSHYVPEGGAVDEEALSRGNSRYFPLSVEPMLPEALSNGLCSLKPNVPRLAMVVDMSFSAQGERLDYRLYPAVIRSRQRLTYERVEQALTAPEGQGEGGDIQDCLPMLHQAEALSRAMLERRRERGAINFDIPEAEFLFDEQGDISGVQARPKLVGHRIIEEFMIAANESAAEFVSSRKVGGLYRVHKAPDPARLLSLRRFLFKYHPELKRVLRRPPQPGGKITIPPARDVAKMLEKAAQGPLGYMINKLLLRCMMQARYCPKQYEHFALASPCYCHFTSPIRRYADLVVHRRVKMALGLAAHGQGGTGGAAHGRGRPRGEADMDALERVARQCNNCEDSSNGAEREITRRVAALLLRDRVGERFDGVVSGLSDFGVLVELPEAMSEGFAPIRRLRDDYSRYIRSRYELRGERGGRVFRLGQRVLVEIVDVHVERQEVGLRIVG